MDKLGTISIFDKAESDEAVIDIEGIIGVPEWWQFQDEAERTSTYDRFKQRMNDIRNIKSKSVTVNIRSIGGNVNDALLIHDMLVLSGMQSNKKITTNCFGYCASAATIIAQAAGEGKRNVSSNVLYLIHNSSSYSVGNKEEIQVTIQVLEATDKTIANVYASRSGKTADSFTTLMQENNGNGKWIPAQEVIDAGLADNIIEVTPTSNEEIKIPSNFKYPELPKKENSEQSENQINNNQKNVTMKVQKAWNFILNFFGFDPEKDNELTTAQVEKLNNELSTKQTQITNLGNEKTALETKVSNLQNSVIEKDTEIANLKTKNEALQSEIDKGKGEETKTEDKDDPSVKGVKTQTENQSAYAADAACFKD